MQLIHNWEESEGVPGGGTTRVDGECHCPIFPIKWAGGNGYGVSVVEIVQSAKVYFLESSKYETADLLLRAAIARINYLYRLQTRHELRQALEKLELARAALQDALPVTATLMAEAVEYLKEGVKA